MARSSTGTAARAARADTPHPTRDELLEQHAAARVRRDSAVLGSDEWEAATADVGRIEVEIARLDRTATPPRL